MYTRTAVLFTIALALVMAPVLAAPVLIDNLGGAYIGTRTITKYPLPSTSTTTTATFSESGGIGTAVLYGNGNSQGGVELSYDFPSTDLTGGGTNTQFFLETTSIIRTNCEAWETALSCTISATDTSNVTGYYNTGIASTTNQSLVLNFSSTGGGPAFTPQPAWTRIKNVKVQYWFPQNYTPGSTTVKIDVMRCTPTGGAAPVPPACSLSSVGGSSVMGTSVNFQAYFSAGGAAASAYAFSGTDVTVGGTAPGTKTVTITGGPTTYNINVAGMTGSGTVTAQVAAGLIVDAWDQTNSASNLVSVDFTKAVPPSFTSTGSTTFTVGQAGAFTPTASGTPAATITRTAGALPSGVTFSSGVLSGTPAAGSAGTYTLTLQATNGFAPDATQGFTLTVQDKPVLGSPTATAITTDSAVLGATITSNGHNAVTGAGVAYGLAADPTASGGTSAATSGAFTVSVGSLTPNTVYHYRGYATNGVGTAYAPDATFTTVAGAPGTPTASGVTASGFTAAWTAPSGTATTTGYRLDVSTQSDFGSFVTGYNNLAVTGTSQAVTGLAAGTLYYFRVRAVNAGGTSAPSAAGQAMTIVVAPTSVVATAGTQVSTVTVTWAAVTGATHYQVSRIPAAGGTLTTVSGWVTTLSFTDTPPLTGVDYAYSVQASVGAGTTPGAASAQSTGWAAIPAPASTTAGDGDRTDGVGLSWATVSSLPAAGRYRVYRALATSPTAWEAVGSWVASSSGLDATAVPGLDYVYSVAAAADGAGGREGAKSPANAGYRAIAAPTGIAATDGTSTASVTINWTPMAGLAGTAAHRVYRTTPDAPTAWSALSGWQTGTTYTDTTAAPGITYLYTVHTAATDAGTYASPYGDADQGFRRTTPLPDAMVRLAGSDDYAGEGAYSGTQQVSNTIVIGTTSTFQVLLRNSGNGPDTLRLAASPAPTGWAIRIYDAFAGGTDCTTLMTDGTGLVVTGLAAGGTQALRVEVTAVDDRALANNFAPSVTCTSLNDLAVQDAVSIALTPMRPLAITSVVPTHLQRGAGTTFQVIGEGFMAGLTVTLVAPTSGDVTPVSAVVTSSTQLDCTADLTGLALGARNLHVSMMDGQTASLAGAASVLDRPVLSHPTATALATTSATVGATITDDGGAAITASGVAYGLAADPTIGGATVAASATSGAFTVALGSLTPNTVYHYRAYATNAMGTSYAPDATITTLPEAPAMQASASITTDGFVARWDAPAGSATITEYRLDVSEASDFSSCVPGYSDLSVTGTSQAVTGLAAGTHYYIRVRAVNAGGASAAATAQTMTTVAAPTGVDATDGTLVSTVEVTWSAVTGATHYQVWRGPAADSLAAISAWQTATSFTDLLLPIGVDQHYAVVASVGAGTTPGTLSATDTGWAAIPAPPSIAAGDGDRTDGVSLSWIAISTLPTAGRYRVYRALAATPTAWEACGGWVDAITALDATAVPGVDYMYSVTAAADDAGGRESAMSPADPGHRAIAAPDVLTATDSLYTDRVEVAWTAMAGLPATAVHRLYRMRTNTADPWTPITGWQSETTFSDTTAEPGVSYLYSATTAASADGTYETPLGTADAGARQVTPQPDLMIGLAGATAYVGDGVYAGDQCVARTVVIGTTATFHVLVRNDGNGGDSVVLRANDAPAGWAVHYYDAFIDGIDYTTEMTSTGGWVRLGLAKGDVQELRVEVTALDARALATAFTPAISAKSMANALVEDKVTVAATAILPLAITHLTPTAVRRGAGLAFQVTGEGFMPGLTVTLVEPVSGDVTAVSTTVTSSTLLDCTVDLTGAPLGTRNLRIVMADAQTGTLADALTVLSAPDVTSITPTSAKRSGVVQLRLAATDITLPGATAALVQGGTSLPITGLTDPADGQGLAGSVDLGGAPLGAWDVVITNPDGPATTLAGGFAVQSAPTITAVTPAEGMVVAGVAISIAGTDFQPGATVTLASGTEAAAMAVATNSGTQIDGTVDLSGATPGLWQITVTNLDGSTAVADFDVTVAQVTLTATWSTGGVVNPDAATITYNTDFTFTAVPNEGYAVGTWSLGGAVVQTGGLSYTLAGAKRDAAVHVQFAKLPVYRVALTCTPASPVTVGTAMALHATPTGGIDVRYRFLARSLSATSLTVIRDWASVADCVDWTPTPGTYLVMVEAREATAPASSLVSGRQYISVYKPLTAVTVDGDRGSPVPMGRRVVLTATATGGHALSYRYEVRVDGDADPVWVRDFSTSRVTWWTATAIGSYTVTVIVRDGADGREASTTIRYTVVAPLSAVTIAATPASPLTLGTNVNLTATATGGAKVEYRYLLGYRPDTATSRSLIVWDRTAAYGESSDTVFAPTVPGVYNIRVYAREVGSTAAHDVASSVSPFTDLVYIVKAPPLSDFTIDVTPADPGPGSVITATPLGGASLLWKFFARKAGTSTWILLHDFSADNTALLSAPSGETWVLRVYAKETASKLYYDKAKDVIYTVK